MPLLLDRLIKKSNLYSAWHSLRKNPDSQGIDGVSIRSFENDLAAQMKDIRKKILARTYQFVPPKGRLLDKGEGKKRPLKIPAVRDRVVQRAIRNVIEKRFKKFHYPCSYGYIEKRKREDAAARIAVLRDRKYHYVLEADIKSFFDRVDQKILLEKILPELPDDSINWLIEGALNTEIGNRDYFTNEEILKYFLDGTIGISQGGILSPLFANIYLSSFDRYMLDRKYQLIRYADDFIVMCKKEAEARQAHSDAEKFLKESLRLELHSEGTKTQVTDFGKGFDFLGYAFINKKILPAKKAVQRFRTRVTEIAHKDNFVDLITMGMTLKNVIYGWANAYGFCRDHGQADFLAILSSLDGHIKERVTFILDHCELRPKTGAMRGFHFMKYGIPSIQMIADKK